MPYRLLALDVDGTLLDPAGQLRPAVRDTVLAVQQRGVRVVLCTGRRFRTTRPIARELQITGPLIVHNGALVKDCTSGVTLQRRSMSEEVRHEAAELLRTLSAPMLYIDGFHANIDIVTEPLHRAHPFQQEYLQDYLENCQIVDRLTPAPAHGVLLMGIMADYDSIEALRPTVESGLEGRARVHMLTNKNYQGFILEVLQAGVSKWQALAQLAAQEGISHTDIMAVGDDRNDMDMLHHAGLGIAMGNAIAEVQAAADVVTGSNADDGLAQALERFILRA